MFVLLIEIDYKISTIRCCSIQLDLLSIVEIEYTDLSKEQEAVRLAHDYKYGSIDEYLLKVKNNKLSQKAKVVRKSLLKKTAVA